MAEELDLIGEVLKSNSIRRDNTLYDYSLVNGQLQIIKEPGVMDAVSDVAGVIGDVVGQGVEKFGDVAQSTFEGTKGVAKGVPIGLSNFAKEFNKTFLPGYEENVVPFLQENIPGLKSLNNFVGDIFEYKNKAQEIGGEFIGEPIGEFGVTGGAIGGVAKSAGIGNRFLANVLGYGTAEVIAVPADEQGLLSMGIDYLSPDSPVTTAILESLKSDEDQSIFMQKLQKAPENFFVGGVVGEQLDKAVRGVGTLYKYIKNSPKLESIKQELKGGISTLSDTAREFIEKDAKGTYDNVMKKPGNTSRRSFLKGIIATPIAISTNNINKILPEGIVSKSAPTIADGISNLSKLLSRGVFPDKQTLIAVEDSIDNKLLDLSDEGLGDSPDSEDLGMVLGDLQQLKKANVFPAKIDYFSNFSKVLYDTQVEDVIDNIKSDINTEPDMRFYSEVDPIDYTKDIGGLNLEDIEKLDDITNIPKTEGDDG